jgi:hypothetical protein
MASTYLSKTFSSAGNRKTMTFSFWIKKALANMIISGVGVHTVSQMSQFAFQSDGVFYIFDYNSAGTLQYEVTSTPQYRDSSAWYHVVLAIDTTQATNTDRIKFYINGELQSLSGTYPALNYDCAFNNNVQHAIGNRVSQSAYVDGILAHYHFIDGTAYQASDFGETDANGVWKPKTSPSVTYGTNGYFLKFENSGSMGADSSGNNNDFTLSGGALTQTLDTPSNVYCTMNPLDNYFANGTFSQGNNTITTVNTGYPYNTATMGVNKGKWYWECKWSAQPTGSSNQVLVGIAKRTCPSTTTWLGSAAYTYGYQGTGGVHNNNGTIATYTTWSIGDVIGVALDMDNNRLYFSRNGTWQGSSDPANGTNPISITAPDTTDDIGFYFPAFGDGNNSLQETGQFNFGNGTFGTTSVSSAGSNGNGSIFEYDVPTGYYALNTKNLATYG